MAETAVWRAHTIERNGLRIEVRAQPAVNLALVHNQVPLITGLSVRMIPTLVSGLQIAVRLHGSGGELAPEWSRSFAEGLPPGGIHTFNDLGEVIPDIEHLKPHG
jgi:hypothetical protein